MTKLRARFIDADWFMTMGRRVFALQRKHRLNKFDPGSLLGRVVWLLEKEGLDDAAKEVRKVSRIVVDAWKTRER